MLGAIRCPKCGALINPSPLQKKAIKYLKKHGETTTVALAKALKVKLSSLYRALEKLEELKIIKSKVVISKGVKGRKKVVSLA